MNLSSPFLFLEVACNLAMFEDFEIERRDYIHRKREFSVMHAEEFRLSFPEGVC